MSRRSKGSSGSGHRKFRQKLNLDGAVIAGREDVNEIVYCYRFPSVPGRVKIGYSSRGLSRVVEQSTAFPDKPEVIFVIHDKRARDIEVAFHEALAARQSDVMGTEWFDAGWPELLAVSPILRRATGAHRRRVNRKFMATVAFGALGATAYPMLALAPVGMANGLPIGEVLAGWGGYGAEITRGNFDIILRSWQSAMILPEKAGLSGFWRIAPAVVASLPMIIPWLRWRKQAY